MKFKTTRQHMNENYNIAIAIDYCSAEYLLRYTQPIAYSAGVYGWNCDYYEVLTKTGTRVLINTGYRGLINKNNKADYKSIKKYNDKAQAIVRDEPDYKKQKTKINNLLQKFVTESIA